MATKQVAAGETAAAGTVVAATFLMSVVATTAAVTTVTVLVSMTAATMTLTAPHTHGLPAKKGHPTKRKVMALTWDACGSVWFKPPCPIGQAGLSAYSIRWIIFHLHPVDKWLLTTRDTQESRKKNQGLTSQWSTDTWPWSQERDNSKSAPAWLRQQSRNSTEPRMSCLHCRQWQDNHARQEMWCHCPTRDGKKLI